MIAPFIGPALGNIMQVAWVTPDLDRTLAVFRELYRVPEFLVIEPDFPSVVFGEAGQMKLRVALANVDAMQLEVIQPVGGGVDRFYRDYLPGDGSFATVFHHVCVRVGGSVEDWDAYLETLGGERPIALTGDLGPEARVVYTDERATIGMIVEHVWFSPAQHARMSAAIPTYRTK
jgi:hypothetical protein